MTHSCCLFLTFDYENVNLNFTLEVVITNYESCAIQQ